MNKKKVIFIGSFKSKSKTGHVGGQMFACTGLVNSNLKNHIHWLTLDTTAKTNKKRSFASKLIGAIKRAIQYKYLLSTNKIHTVLAFCSRGNSFLEKGLMIKQAHKRGIKTILAPRSGLLLDDIKESSKFKQNVQSIFDCCDYIVCQGSFWKTYFDTNFSNVINKTKVIHNWIDVLPVHRIQSESPNTTILFLGWIDQNKGVFDIVEVADQLRDENITWILGGNGKDFDKVQKLIKSLKLENKVLLKGWVLGGAKDKLMQRADLFILPSYKEGLPNAMLEAMANGIPAVVSNVGAVSDIIENGQSGLLIEPGNLNDIKEAILKLHQNDDLKQRMGISAKKRVQKMNSIEVGISKFKEILI